MIIEHIESFKHALPSMGRVLGFDVGEKTIGIALSDAYRMIASPLVTLKKERAFKVADDLKKIVLDHKIQGIVIGLPMNMNGTEGPRCESIRQFAKNIDPFFEIPLILWDERLSTMAVSRTMINADLSRQRQKEVVDKLAASYILQGALDAMRK